MKNARLFAGFLLLASVSCQHTDAVVNPVVDQRDQRVGLYACAVKIENFKTQEVFSSYLDTLEISKQGDNQLFIKSHKDAQFPTLEPSDSRGSAYAGIYTNLSFDQNQLQLTTGADIKFYAYKGRKLN